MIKIKNNSYFNNNKIKNNKFINKSWDYSKSKEIKNDKFKCINKLIKNKITEYSAKNNSQLNNSFTTINKADTKTNKETLLTANKKLIDEYLKISDNINNKITVHDKCNIKKISNFDKINNFYFNFYII